jgi:hypothetical protein
VREMAQVLAMAKEKALGMEKDWEREMKWASARG